MFRRQVARSNLPGIFRPDIQAGAARGNYDRGVDAGFLQRADQDGADRGHEGVEPWCPAGVQSRSERYPLGQTETQEGSVTGLIYVNTSKQIRDPDHIKVFANTDAAETWFEETTPKAWRSIE